MSLNFKLINTKKIIIIIFLVFKLENSNKLNLFYSSLIILNDGIAENSVNNIMTAISNEKALFKNNFYFQNNFYLI
jgi:hypothetical protein